MSNLSNLNNFQLKKKENTLLNVTSLTTRINKSQFSKLKILKEIPSSSISSSNSRKIPSISSSSISYSYSKKKNKQTNSRSTNTFTSYSRIIINIRLI